MKGNIVVVALAIVALAGIEIYALHKGVDGKLLALVVMSVAGLGGFHVKKLKEAVKSLLK